MIAFLKRKKNLPKGYYFRFYDGYRSLAVQQELFEVQKQKLHKEHSEWDEDKIMTETHKYIADPSTHEESREKNPSPHTTGGAVDIGLIRLTEDGGQLLKQLEQDKISGALDYPIKEEEKTLFEEANSWVNEQALEDDLKNNWLAEYRYNVKKSLIFRNHSETVDMGTPFDYFGQESETAYYENILESDLNGDDKKRRENRRILFWAMKKAGIANYPGEWWHFSYGDQEWAANKNEPTALFGEVGLDEKNLAIEKTRRLVYLKTIRNISKSKNPVFID